MTVRRAVRLVLTGTLLAAAATAVLPFAPGTPDAGAWSEGPCPTAAGVTVVIDFHELGGGVWVRCTDSTVDTGFQALDAVAVPWSPAVRFPGFLCRIDGKPSNDPCQTTSPASAYWSYWIADRGGAWCYSSFGAGNRNPPEGTVEGWSFSLNRTSTSLATPRYSPPPRVPGAPATNGAGCDPSKTPSTTPPPAPTTAPPRPDVRAPGSGNGGSTAAPGGVATGTGGTLPGATTPTTAAPSGTVVTAPPPDATVAPAPTVPSPDAAPSGGSSSGGASGQDPSTEDTIVGPDGEEIAVNAGGPRAGAAPASSPAGVIVAVVLIAALTATSMVVRRRVDPT